MSRKRFWPSPTQELLLGVCLERDAVAAIEAWKAWKARVDLDDLDRASFHIMSLVHQRLVELGISDPDSRRIKGLHRYRWTQDQVVSRGKRELLNALHRENIPTLLIAQEMEIVTPPADAARAVRLLEEQGWMAAHFDPVRSVQHSPGCHVLHPDFGEVALRWRILRSQRAAGREEELWQAAREFEYERTPTRVLCPADQFLVACEHGMHLSSAAGLQWLADCVLVIREAPAPFDWARLAEQSRRFQLSLQIRDTLAYLEKHFENSIPRNVIAGLAGIPASLDSRIEYFLAGRPEAKQHDLTHKFGVAAGRYLNLKDGGRMRQFLQDVPRFLRLISNRNRRKEQAHV